uniref:Ionotropic receptor 64a n=1 Tax=Aulacocentrum confusum TaxID=2767324 RepID=A0A7G8Z9I6_9HYME|nr:ionotropic receptor 64a [Aulacocentrum confusum]
MEARAMISYHQISDKIDLKSILHVDYYHIGVLLDYDCEKSMSFLDQFSRLLVFNESYHWLMLTESSAPPVDVLRDLPLSVDTEMTVAMRNNDSFQLLDVYNPSHRHGGRVNITYKGQWTPQGGLRNQLTQFKYRRRQNFNLLPLNFSIVLLYPPKPDFHTYLTEPINPHLDSMTRYHYALVMQLKDFFNFSMNLQQAKTWGYLVNGTFNGILGDMVKGIVDVSIAPFQYKEERMDVCEFTVETWTVRPMFIFRHPRTSDVRNGFLKPFAKEIWWFVLLGGLIYWIFLYGTAKIGIYFSKSDAENTLMSIPASETGLITLAAVSQQGLSEGPTNISGRIVFLSLFLWALLLFQFYSASIVGSLLSPPPRWITTLKNLSDSSLDCAMEDVAYSYDYYATTTNPMSLEFYDSKIKPTKKNPKGSYLKAAEGLNRMRKGAFAFHLDTATGYRIIQDTFSEDEICELQEVELLTPRVTTLVTAKHSPFKKMIIYGLRKIVEHGITNRLRKVWHHSRPKCPESHSSKPQPVPMGEFSPALFLLLMGLAFSVFVMLAEYLHYYYNRPVDKEDSTPEISSRKSSENFFNDELPNYNSNSA